jgi:predicted Fe-Mo cluster-binding NifX family protein
MSNKIRIAIAADNNLVCGHFGHCPEFVIVDIENKKVICKEVIHNPGHQPGFLPGFLGEKKVNVVIAGGMGAHAQELFLKQNITPVIGAVGDVDSVISAYIENRLKCGKSLCSHQ